MSRVNTAKAEPVPVQPICTEKVTQREFKGHVNKSWGAKSDLLVVTTSKPNWIDGPAVMIMDKSEGKYISGVVFTNEERQQLIDLRDHLTTILDSGNISHQV